MNKKNALIAIIIVAAALVLWLVFRDKEPKVTVFDSQAAVKVMESNDRTVPIEEYVKRNIVGLSGEAGVTETLGGTFQVTKITAQNGTGTVEYEDGHNAYTATFTYSKDKKGLVSVTGFTVKK